MGRLREPGLRGAHLLAASGFALAQPLFDILGKNAEFFAVRGSTPADIVIFALVITFVPAAVLLAVELLVGLASERAALALHYAFLAALFALFALQALKRIGFDSTFVLVVGGILVGIAIAAAVARVALVRTFMTVLAAAPVVFLCVFLFSSSVTDLVFPGDTEVRVANVGPSAPVVFLLLDEFPVLSIMDENGEIDAGRYPNFARLAAAIDLVQEHDDPVGLDHGRGALDAHRAGPRAPEAPRVPEVPAQPVHAARQGLPDERDRVADAALPAAALRPRGSRTGASACRGSYSDTRIVYLHLLSPPALEDRLPAIDESWGEFGNEAAEEPSDSLSGVKVDRPKPEGKTFYAGRIRQFETFVDSLKPPVEGSRRSTSCTSSCRTGRGSTSPTDGRAPSPRPTRPAATASAGGTTAWRTRRTSGTCSSSRTRTRCSGSSSTSSRPPDSGTRRSCSSRPTTASASTAATTGGRRARRTSPSSRSRRSSSGSPASRRGASRSGT